MFGKSNIRREDGSNPLSGSGAESSQCNGHNGMQFKSLLLQCALATSNSHSKLCSEILSERHLDKVLSDQSMRSPRRGAGIGQHTIKKKQMSI